MINPLNYIQIRHKLFAIFVLSNILLIVSMWQVFHWSFNKSFVSYATERDQAFVEQMATRAANLYSEFQSWDFLIQESRQEKQWQQTKLDNIHNLTPLPDTPNLDILYPSQYYRTRFLLFSGKQQALIGNGDFDKVLTHEVVLNGETIGYVGLQSIRELVQDQTVRFVKQQSEAFLLISTFMLVIAALLTWPLAQWLSAPISSIRQATRKLAAGEFDTRLRVVGKDELANLGRDFNNLAITLDKTRQARKRWVADTAHELRTPVAILRGEIEAMQDGIIKMTPEALNSLLQETLHIGRMIDDLNQLSMHDMGSLSYHMELIKIDAVLVDTIQSLSRPFEEAGILVDLNIARGEFEMMADADRLFQLFSNLMNNSLKYTNSPGTLTILLCKKDNFIRILFEDSAPGVSDEDKERIFEQFYRVENSRNRMSGGRGLGLAICHNIVEGHHGRISAYHAKAGGLGIKIEFPLN